MSLLLILLWDGRSSTLFLVLPRCLYNIVHTEEYPGRLDGSFERLDLAID